MELGVLSKCGNSPAGMQSNASHTRTGPGKAVRAGQGRAGQGRAGQNSAGSEGHGVQAGVLYPVHVPVGHS